MTALQELIDTADRLCKNLDIASQNEKNYTTNICLELERYSWEIYRMMNEIKEIKDYCGK
jgi:hypothetical protein